jgi:hypothetical protein
MNYNDFINIIDFLGNDMTEAQAIQLLDKAKHELNFSDILSMGNYSCFNYRTPLYSLVSEYKGECGIYC